MNPRMFILTLVFGTLFLEIISLGSLFPLWNSGGFFMPLSMSLDSLGGDKTCAGLWSCSNTLCSVTANKTVVVVGTIVGAFVDKDICGSMNNLFGAANSLSVVPSYRFVYWLILAGLGLEFVEWTLLAFICQSGSIVAWMWTLSSMASVTGEQYPDFLIAYVSAFHVIMVLALFYTANWSLRNTPEKTIDV